MSDILNKIVSDMRPALEVLQQKHPISELKTRLNDVRKPLDFAGAMRKSGINIIAELKKASPSKGLIRENFNVKELALELEAHGAATLSVLTERNYFLGGIENLKIAAETVNIPLLRKDFIFCEYQIYEARANGADAILLIAAMLTHDEIVRFTDIAHMLGMSVLGEAHNAEELEKLSDTEIDLLGINARNLRTFATDLKHSISLLRQIPKHFIAVAESAIRNRDDIQEVIYSGANCFLIGEALMRADSPGAKLQELL